MRPDIFAARVRAAGKPQGMPFTGEDDEWFGDPALAILARPNRAVGERYLVDEEDGE